ncbi:MAG: DUF86 domain-containing protein [Chitinophagales bacterium]
MSRDLILYLEDIKLACDKIAQYIKGYSFDEFMKDEKTVDAVVRNIGIIGEATKKVPANVRRKYSDIEWRKVAGMLDVVIHNYSGVDYHIVWDVAVNEAPKLSEQISKMVDDFNK